MYEIDVTIATYRKEGIERVAAILPPEEKCVRYIISWQEDEGYPIPETFSKRGDVEVYRFEKKGLSANRNNAISKCKGDIVVIGDDDLQYHPDFIEIIRKAYNDNPQQDILLFKVDFDNPKTYPVKDCNLEWPLPQNYYCSSVEISFRREKIGELRFQEDIGLGIPGYECGEDELFLWEAIKKRLHCRFINKSIATHKGATTGEKNRSGVIRGQGYVIRKMYPVTFILRLLLKAYRLSWNKDVSFYPTLKCLFQGAFRRNKKEELP